MSVYKSKTAQKRYKTTLRSKLCENKPSYQPARFERNPWQCRTQNPVLFRFACVLNFPYLKT